MNQYYLNIYNFHSDGNTIFTTTYITSQNKFYIHKETHFDSLYLTSGFYSIQENVCNQKMTQCHVTCHTTFIIDNHCQKFKCKCQCCFPRTL